MELEVLYSKAAAEVIEDLRARAKSRPDGLIAKYWRPVVEVLTTWLPSAELALDPSHLLRGDLAGIYRLKKGRHRVFYIASSELRKVIVLYFGYRKDGDKDDAYEDFGRRLRRGDFDSHFDELRLKRPGKKL